MSRRSTSIAEWRAQNPKRGPAAARAAARQKAKAARAKGVLVAQPCATCGAERVEMHHEDYSRPLDVVWLCRPCHLERHREMRRAA